MRITWKDRVGGAWGPGPGAQASILVHHGGQAGVWLYLDYIDKIFTFKYLYAKQSKQAKVSVIIYDHRRTRGKAYDDSKKKKHLKEKREKYSCWWINAKKHTNYPNEVFDISNQFLTLICIVFFRIWIIRTTINH